MSLTALLFVQCTPAQDFQLGNSATVIPLTIKQGTTAHFLTDYYPQWDGATNLVANDERLQLTPTADNWAQFDITTQSNDALVSTIDVWHDAEKLSIVVLGGQRDTQGSYMSSTCAKGGNITIVASKPVVEAVAMWQNEVIEDVKIEGNTIKVAIPRVAKGHQRSAVRIFAASESGRFNDVLLPLEYGKVVVDAEDIPVGEGIVKISAKKGYGMEQLLKAIEEALGHSRHHVEVTIPYSQGGMLDTLHSTAQVLGVDYTAEGIVVDTIVDPVLYGRLKDFITKEMK